MHALGKVIFGFQISGILIAQTTPGTTVDRIPRPQQYPAAVYQGKVSMPAFKKVGLGELFPDGG
jgi:hypothetical protein